MRKLHDEEKPISLLASIMVNQQRDPKKSKPLPMSDFYLYEPKDSQNVPSERFGAAALALVKQNKFPSWALFCFKELMQGASGNPPALLAYIGVDCLLLAPVGSPEGYTGLLIATESASGAIREMSSVDGDTVKLKIPLVETKVMAQEDVFLQKVS